MSREAPNFDLSKVSGRKIRPDRVVPRPKAADFFDNYHYGDEGLGVASDGHGSGEVSEFDVEMEQGKEVVTQEVFYEDEGSSYGLSDSGRGGLFYTEQTLEGGEKKVEERVLPRGKNFEKNKVLARERDKMLKDFFEEIGFKMEDLEKSDAYVVNTVVSNKKKMSEKASLRLGKKIIFNPGHW